MNIAKNMELIFVAAVISFCTLSYVADSADNTQISTLSSSSSSQQN